MTVLIIFVGVFNLLPVPDRLRCLDSEVGQHSLLTSYACDFFRPL